MGRPKNEEEISPESQVSAAVEKPETLPILTQDSLLTIIASMQQQLLQSQKAQADANEKLAGALLELARPKESPKTKRQLADEENDRVFEQRQREYDLKKKAVEQWAHDNCDHIAGCNPLSEERDLRGRTSIAWHKNDIGVEVGICTVCQRIFHPSQPDYTTWRRKPSINRISASGSRTVMDLPKAIEESYLHDID